MDDYEALDEAGRGALILQGAFLADREENGLIVQLYSVGAFYGEIPTFARRNMSRWKRS